ncbi:MAG: sterol desaturase family protein [Terriglobia bacterium]
MVFGGLGVGVLARVSSPAPLAWLAGFLVGLFYANGFEYFLHRFLLHRPGSYLTRVHFLHHDSLGGAEEALYVNFLGRPWWVVLLLGMNAAPFAAAEWWLRVGMAPGMLIGFVVYYIAAEEIHWRSHVGWLPSWLGFARRHHMLHHAGTAGRFNVFLPLFDRLLGT